LKKWLVYKSFGFIRLLPTSHLPRLLAIFILCWRVREKKPQATTQLLL